MGRDYYLYYSRHFENSMCASVAYTAGNDDKKSGEINPNSKRMMYTDIYRRRGGTGKKFIRLHGTHISDPV